MVTVISYSKWKPDPSDVFNHSLLLLEEDILTSNSEII